MEGRQLSEQEILDAKNAAAKLRKKLRTIGMDAFLDYCMKDPSIPRPIMNYFGIILPVGYERLPRDTILRALEIMLIKEMKKRENLPDIKNLSDIAKILANCQNVIVVTGAGISTSLGIPDFRSSDGIYSRLEKYNLSDPQELFDIALFRQDPSIFYDFAKELLPEDRGYSPTHAFIRLLQDRGILLRQYTQNIDDIESSAGIKEDKLLQCHGSFKTASCLTCGNKVPGHSLFHDIRLGTIPKCSICSELQTKLQQKTSRAKRKADSEDDEAVCYGVMKPDITFFGEPLASEFRTQMLQDREVADLLICIGTSLQVAPVAGIPHIMPANVPQLFISRECAGREYVFDLEILGQCDTVVRQLADEAGWLAQFEDIVQRGQKTP